MLGRKQRQRFGVGSNQYEIKAPVRTLTARPVSSEDLVAQLSMVPVVMKPTFIPSFTDRRVAVSAR